MVESGISLPPPDELADSALNAELCEVINALALMGAYLEHTDHLSDRELYLLLWGDVKWLPLTGQPENKLSSNMIS